MIWSGRYRLHLVTVSHSELWFSPRDIRRRHIRRRHLRTRTRYINPFCAGIVFIRHNLTSVDDSVPHTERMAIFLMAVDP